MDEPKVPSHETSWEEIDIFLFSNGQQHSPPRKYHLRADELNFWEATLGLLARCQYGSMHSAIHLYTTDGKKVENPMELSNGGAYVAVTPPDPFVAGAYEKYLMKASRSWEKRQARKSGSTEQISDPDEVIIQNDTSKSGINKDVSNIRTADQNIKIEAIVSGKTEDQVKYIEKPQGAAQHNTGKSIVTTIRHVEKRRLPPMEPPATRTSILRKMRINHVVPPNSRKNWNVRKENNGKGNVQLVPQKLMETGAAVLGKNKTIAAKPPTQGTTVIPTNPMIAPNLEQEIKSVRISSVTIPNHKSQATDNTQVDYAIEDKDIILILNFFKTADDELRDQMSDRIDADAIPLISHYHPIKDPNRQPFKPIMISDGKTFEPITKNFQVGDNHTSIIVGNTAVTSLPDVLTVAYNEIRSGDSRIEKNSQDSSPSDRLPNTLTENNVVTHMSNEDDVNIKLLIEIKDEDGVVRTIQKNLTQKPRSLTDIKGERDSNVNINSKMLGQSKSLDSIPATEHACCKDPKVIVVRCPCDHNNHADTIKIKKHAEKDFKTYFIIVPIITNAENGRCNCKHNKEVTTTSEKGVQNAQSLTKLNAISSVKEIIMSVAVCESEKLDTGCDGHPISRKESVSSRTLKTESVVTEQQVAMLNGNKLPEYVIASQISPKCEEPPKVDYDAEIRDNCCMTCKSMRDTCTQTEWCSVLLEVRRDGPGAGRYTFHLPPLRVLKHYAAFEL